MKILALVSLFYVGRTQKPCLCLGPVHEAWWRMGAMCCCPKAGALVMYLGWWLFFEHEPRDTTVALKFVACRLVFCAFELDFLKIQKAWVLLKLFQNSERERKEKKRKAWFWSKVCLKKWQKCLKFAESPALTPNAKKKLDLEARNSLWEFKTRFESLKLDLKSQKLALFFGQYGIVIIPGVWLKKGFCQLVASTSWKTLSFCGYLSG